MIWLDNLLTGKTTPNVYRLTSRAAATTITNRVEKAGWRCFVIDGDTIQNKRSFIETSSRALNFPTWSGKNWDAFYDSLTSLSQSPADGYVVLYENFANFATDQAQEWQMALEILQDAVRFWQQHNKPMIVLLRKTGGVVNHLPALPIRQV